ncbi:mucin-7-like [Prinia subflava]|uniref:mucin-7-like n=1 Tax=Prinia subflava TaxID=208062 RepID=UPI002FE1DBD8
MFGLLRKWTGEENQRPGWNSEQIGQRTEESGLQKEGVGGGLKISETPETEWAKRRREGGWNSLEVLSMAPAWPLQPALPTLQPRVAVLPAAAPPAPLPVSSVQPLLAAPPAPATAQAMPLSAAAPSALVLAAPGFPPTLVSVELPAPAQPSVLPACAAARATGRGGCLGPTAGGTAAALLTPSGVPSVPNAWSAAIPPDAPQVLLTT